MVQTDSKEEAELGTLGRHALAYARKGWRVFPCRPRDKRPLIDRWPELATTDEQKVTEWWTRRPNANIGLACGRWSGVVVVDLDPKSGGLDSWADFVDIHCNVETLSTITGSGGEHHFFIAPPFELRNTAGNIGTGIDTRADGGYVILPPSVHPNGERYEWDVKVPPIPVPNWLLEKWRGFSTTRSRDGSAAPSEGTPLSLERQAWMREICIGWGLKEQQDGQFRGSCPYPHLNGPCDCPQGFRIDPRTGRWWCYCSDHPKLDDVVDASGWIFCAHSSASTFEPTRHVAPASLANYVRKGDHD